MPTEIIFLPQVTNAAKLSVLNFVDLWNGGEDFISIHTSGSTGNPKEIKISKKAMVASAQATGSFFGFRKGKHNLLALSPEYIAGMMQIVRSMVFDMTLIVAPLGSNPLQHLSSHSIDFSAFVPLQVKAILANPETKKRYQAIGNVIIGGAPIPENLFNDIALLSNRSFATFGMTETVSHIALKLIDNGNAFYGALPGVKLAQSETGCLIIDAPNILSTPITTNDRVELKDEFSFKWLGRANFTINSGGIKIQPEEVEGKLFDFIKDPFYISHLPDETLGQRVVLYIERKPYSQSKIDSLMISMAQRLGKYEIPKTIFFMDRFERTTTGKIIRK